jgi:poly-gamma-glutamate synthesis protein (capsule biosynthesis protein)
MSTSGPYTGYPSFKSPADLVTTLKNIGLDIAYRTNHTMDFGIKGLNATTEILKKHNINQIAGYATEEASKEIFVYQKNDLKISFLGYIYGMNGLPIPKKWMINLIDLKKIESDIKIAKTKSDFVVVSLHFGNEYERYPSKWQKETAQKIADFGADMIIASHPHVLQPVDLLTTKDGRKVYVAYGLGNFYCGQRFQYTDAGAILRYTIEKTNGVTKLKDIAYLPTWVAEYKEAGKTQYKILPSQEYLELYKAGQAKFLSASNYNRMKQTYTETVKHLDNPKINFTEYKK